MTRESLDFKFKIQDNGLFQRMQEHGDRVGPYVGAAMRRTFFAYRRQFIAGKHKSNPVKFGRRRGSFNSPSKTNAKARNANSFLIEFEPKDEKTAKLKDLRVAYYTRSLVAAYLEFGSKPKAKGSGWLAIPAGVALRTDGSARRYWSSPEMLKKHRRDVKTKFAQRRGGTAMILVDVGNVGGKKAYGPQKHAGYGPRTKRGNLQSKRDKKTRWRIAFRLVKKAKIDPKLGFLSAWDRLGPDMFDERIEKEYTKYMREVWGQRR